MLDLGAHGLRYPGPVHHNLAPAALVEHALRRGEGTLADNGALVAYTGAITGRSPRDRYIVAQPPSQGQIDWGSVNRPLEPAAFQRLSHLMRAYLQNRELFVFDGFAGADPHYRIGVRVVAELAWHALFAHCLLLRPTHAELEAFAPQCTILCAPNVHAAPAEDGTASDVYIVLELERPAVLIGGTHYAGEIKKSVFSLLNYLLPQRGVLPMHCSANLGAGGDTALFFGLSGTGKTTLSADPERRLIGDDEHGWSDAGVFNFEGGCYAKTIRLSRVGEPQIWNAIRFGCVLENVPLDPATRRPDYDSEHYTENTRAAYPVDFIANAEPSGRGGHPSNILFLTCDSFGVLPPLSLLTPEQALYHFLSGYTAKVAGTEKGVTEPEATFSTCFAAPFLPLEPNRYAELLRAKLVRHGSQVWLVNTGWTGGVYGQGSRINLAYTRALLRAVLGGALRDAAFTPDPVFGVQVPRHCPGVPDEVLQPRLAWASGADYDQRARQLAALFVKNFQQYVGRAAPEVRAAGPRVAL
jgi:phosphoenolpyruvate carboxykinase (ATP)